MRRGALLALAALAVAAPAAGAAVPSAQQIDSARRYVDARKGVNSVAVIDSAGRLHGFAPRRTYVTASVIKAMLLVAYLRKAGGRPLGMAERGALGPMIAASDNDRASAIYGCVGDAALRRLAGRAGMRRFSIAGHWGNARSSAEDQARFMVRFDALVPRRHRAYARRLMSSIVPWQRWGFSRYAAAAGWKSFFKGGWRRTERGRLMHEVALFERGGQRFSLAVLTDGNPSTDYGAATLRGVAARLFKAPRGSAAADKTAFARAGLVDVTRLSPTLAFDLRYATRRNLTGRPLPGYCEQWPLLRRAAARDLAAVQRRLRPRRLGLKVLDAYRPARASRALVAWARRTGRSHLVGTYIAARSRHNLGSAVDLTLVRLRGGSQPPMGTRYDHLGPAAHTLNAHGPVLRNRLTLKRAMERHGFASYRREWWHFEHRSRGSRYLDLTLGC